MLTPVSVVYIDPFSDQKLSFDGKDFGVAKNKNSIKASRVPYANVVIHSFKVNSSIGEDELRTMVEIKMYEEAGLDLQKNYKIIYIKKNLDITDTLIIETFAIEEDKTKAALCDVLKEDKYIDFLALPFLSFSTLYTHKILAPKNDLFVYLDETEAFLAIYKNGQYISTKSIMNLQDMVKKLKADDITISVEELTKVLIEKGLDITAYNDDNISLSTALQTLFMEIFNKINDILLHNRNVFGFDNIDRIFMSTANGRVRGLKDFLHSFGYVDTEINDFNLLKNCNAQRFFSCIVASYVSDQYEQNNMAENITLFPRPPRFLKTQVGQLSLFSGIATSIFALYPIYLLVDTTLLQNNFDTLTIQYEAIKKNSAAFNAQLTQVKNELKSATELKTEQEKNLGNIAQSIDELYIMKASSQTYVDFIVKVNRLLKKHSLMVRMIEQKGANKMSIEVVANQNQRDNIAKFMEDLIQEGFLGVTTSEIRSDKVLYISKIEIER